MHSRRLLRLRLRLHLLSRLWLRLALRAPAYEQEHCRSIVVACSPFSRYLLLRKTRLATLERNVERLVTLVSPRSGC